MKFVNEDFAQAYTWHRTFCLSLIASIHKRTKDLGVWRALKHLKAGGLLAVFVDQRWAHGEMLDLFGQPALTTLSPGLFQHLTDARVSTLICRRSGRSRYEAILENLPFKSQDEDDWRARGRSIMRAFHGRLEDWVRGHPDDWFWLQERWKP